jgi:tetratricopeptide (TPR) repeat protein
VDQDGEAVFRQEIRAESGVAYGVIGADLHVWGDGVPLYLLENWHAAPGADPQWLRELPSRLLNARHEVVDFTGRADELSQLHQWRRGDAGFAVRWLYGPGGSGKSRLAAKFASESADDNWKVITATLGPGTVLPVLDSQDLRPGKADGVLLIVDYADHWPASYLALLLSNRLFRRRPDRRTRILMVARTADDWPGIRHKLSGEQPATSSQLLEPLPPDPAVRAEVFTAAVRAFAGYYIRTEIGALRPTVSLGHPDFALTLAVHMAALVAVDMRATERAAPPGAHADMAALTIYLLDREHEHWQQFYGDGAHDLSPGERTFRTPPEVLTRAVFVAALTGPVDRATAVAMLGCLPDEPADKERVIDDHALCYPAARGGQGQVFTPLYPDRLAEDFLALSIPGHQADYPRRAWALPAAYAVLGALIDADLPPGSPATARLSISGQRALLFLAGAAQRWPHVWTRCLSPLLNLSPRLAVAAGSPVLTALAAVGLDPGADVEEDLITTLGKIDRRLPSRPDFDLDLGAASVAGRLLSHSLAAGDGPATRARYLTAYAGRASAVGRHGEALGAAEQAVRTRRDLGGAGPAAQADLADSLSALAGALHDTGRSAEALTPAAEALLIRRQLAAVGPGDHRAELAAALHNRGMMLAAVGRPEEALGLAEEAVAIRRALAAEDPAEVGDYVGALSSLGVRYQQLGRAGEAVAAIREAVTASRGLADAYPGGHLADLAGQVGNLGVALDQDLGREGLPYAQECLALFRRLEQANPDAYRPAVARALNNVGVGLEDQGRLTEALAAKDEAVALNRRLTESGGNPAQRPEFAKSLASLGRSLADAGRLDEALAVFEESIAAYRALADAVPAAHRPDLAETLNDLGHRLARAGRTPQAVAYGEEAVRIFRLAAAADGGVLEPDLVVALNNLGAAVSLNGDPEAALPLAEEAVEIARRLAAAETVIGRTAYAFALNNLTVTLLRLGRIGEAVPTARETVAAFERLDGRGRASASSDLSVARANLAAALTEARRTARRPRWFRRPPPDAR